MLQKKHDWPEQLVGQMMDDVVQNVKDKTEILDLIRLVLRDGQERVLETTVRIPPGINVYRRLTIHPCTDTTVSIIATRARDRLPPRDPPDRL